MKPQEKYTALLDILEASYQNWSREDLIENWKCVGDQDIPYQEYTRQRLIAITVDAEVDEYITEPEGSVAWENQIDFRLGITMELFYEGMDIQEKVEFTLKALRS